jgi:hypothetical protein
MASGTVDLLESNYPRFGKMLYIATAVCVFIIWSLRWLQASCIWDCLLQDQSCFAIVDLLPLKSEALQQRNAPTTPHLHLHGGVRARGGGQNHK